MGVFDDLKPFDADTFDRWLSGAALSHGERVTAQLILAVWDPNYDWQSGRFDVMEALRIWDKPHRAAFLEWAKDPWWP
jgi:hypothetical protein